MTIVAAWFFVISIATSIAVNGQQQYATLKVGKFVSQAQCEQTRQDMGAHIDIPVGTPPGAPGHVILGQCVQE